ncbi:MAG: hypothetical protein ACFFGZ_01785 [Candidatus Thorarchaeota archaeon]
MHRSQEKQNFRLFKGLLIGGLIAIFSLAAFLMVGNGKEVILTTAQPTGPKSSAPLGAAAAQQAELRVDIRYARAENVSLSVGFRRLAPPQETDEDPQVTEKKTVQIFNRGQSIRGTPIPAQAREHMTAVGVQQKWLLADFGFTSAHFPPTPQQLLWVLRIEDHNEDHWHNDSGELSHERGCLEWFNITLGDTTYVSQLHPVFVAGMTCEASISGYRGEIHKIVRAASSKTQGIQLAAPSYSQQGSPTIGVASIVSINKFNNLNDLENRIDTNYFKYGLDEGTYSRWKIYYLIGDDDDTIDDGDIEWMIEKLDWETGGSTQPDQALLLINSHGDYQWIYSTNSYHSGSWKNVVQYYEAAPRISGITDEGVKLFYWMSHCYSYYFWLYMGYYDSDFHHDSALAWAYYPNSVSGKKNDPYDPGGAGEFWCFNRHMDAYHGSSDDPHALEWMYDHSFTYKKYGQNVKSIWQSVQDRTDDSIYEFDTIPGNHLFHLAPNDYSPSYPSGGLIADCRTRGSGSQSNNDGQSWSVSWGSNWAMVMENYGTYSRYVGFWQEVYTYDKDIWVRFDGRAASNYYGPSAVTNLYVFVYDENWENYVYEPAIVLTYSKDSGVISNLRFTLSVDGPSGDGTSEKFYVFFAYSDGWSANWGQLAYIRNVKILA